MKKTLSVLFLVLVLFGCQLNEQTSDLTPESESQEDQFFGLTKAPDYVGKVMNWLGTSCSIKVDSNYQMLIFFTPTGDQNLAAIGMRLRYNHNLIRVRLNSIGDPYMNYSLYFNYAVSNVRQLSSDTSEFSFAGYSSSGLPAGSVTYLFLIYFEPVSVGTAFVDSNVDILVDTNYVEIGNPRGEDFVVEVTE